nr:hypothetical protein I308_02538 [Cryptococcus tetragattii IND107]
MPWTPSIWIYRVYGKYSNRFSHQPTYMMREMWSLDSTMITTTRGRTAASKLRSQLT